MLFSLPAFTLLHVVLSLVGLFAGFVVVGALMAGTRPDRWTALFLTTTILTNATGFGFPFSRLLPSHIVAGISLVILAVAVLARYIKRLAGPWEAVFVLSSVAALYFNVFVLLAQLFAKVPGLLALAPTQHSPVFAATQLVALILFVPVGRAALAGARASRAPVST
jgi:hypothetical protein